MNTIQAYPLTWPTGWPRTEKKLSSKFKTTLAASLNNVRNSLLLFGKDSGVPTENIIISSNVSLGDDKPKDKGVAVWFMWEKKQLCIAVDRYENVQDNLQAIHHIIESRRTELRHGGLHLLRQAFSGFKALPEKTGAEAWFNILGVSDKSNREEIKKAYYEKSAIHHPDKCGDGVMFQKVTEAYQQGLNQLSE